MRRILIVFLAASFATSAFAGITYQFTSTTTGVVDKTFAGTVKSEGAKSRIDVTKSDDVTFPSGSVVLTDGSVLTVLDPAKKTYYSLDLQQYVKQSIGLAQLSPMLKVEFENPHTSVHDDGAGEAIEGYPTRRTTIKTSFDVASKIAGSGPMTVTVQTTTQTWLTDKLPASAANMFQKSGVQTGVPAIDKILEATASLHGFPLKQVMTSRTSVNGGDPIESTTTTTVSGIRVNAAVAPSDFVMPQGYTKIDDPLSAMMKNFGLD